MTSIPVGMTAQLIEHWIGIAEVMGSIPDQVRLSFVAACNCDGLSSIKISTRIIPIFKGEVSRRF